MKATNYSTRIDQSINSIHLAGIATKILQHMDRVRNVSDLSQARRWGMELLQNARDVSYDDQPVKICIRLEEDKLKFSHNGKPFRVKDILSIINQVSSKSGDSGTVGKFGTGFVTTFQLSEEVEIKSVIQDGELPHKPFHIVLDRSGQKNEDILQAIGNAMEELKKVDDVPVVEEFNRDAYNTEFCYHLKTQESKQAAKVGMEDLEYSIFYILLFSRKIKEIRLEFALKDRQETIRYIQTGEGKMENSGLYRMDFEMLHKKEDDEVCVPGSVVYLTQGDITLAATWKDTEGFLKISESTPRLFVDFPLIGAEQFPFPMVIGCRNFKTNEPRSGITLVDSAASRDALVNKEIMGQAVALYKKYLQEAVALNCKGLEHIISIPEWQENKEMSEQWVRKHIYKALYNGITSLLLLPEKNGKRVLLNHPGMYLIQEENKTFRAEVRELLSFFENINVPYDDIDWYGVLQNYPIPEEKVWSLDKILERAEIYAKSVKGQKLEAVLWLQKLYRLGLKKEETNIKIRTGQIKILPNQKYEEEGTLYTVNELKKDPDIPEIFKDVSEKLDCLDGANSWDTPLGIRKELLHLSFDSDNIPEVDTYEKAKVESYIISRSNRNFQVRDLNYYRSVYEKAWEEAWMLLLSCGPDKELYRLGKIVYQDKLPEYGRCKDGWKESLWRPAYIAVLNQITEKIKGLHTVTNLNVLGMQEEEEIFIWLNGIIAKGMEYLPTQELRYKAIFPNQKGQLKPEQWMKRDKTPDDLLKEIAKCFVEESSDCDFYEDTLDRRIKAEDLLSSALTEEDIAFRINQVVQKILSSKILGDTPIEYQMACAKLLEWMDMHEELAGRYFPAFASPEDKARLVTSKAVAGLQRKAKEVDKFLKESGVDSLEKFRDQHLALKNENEELKEELRKLKEKDSNKSGCYSSNHDVFYGEELSRYEEKEREDILRQIGIDGEKYAMNCVKEYFIKQGYCIVTENENCVEMEKEGDGTVTIIYGDSNYYHQAGWDIMVKCKGQVKILEDRISEMAEQRYYIEVKTHTQGSRKLNQFQISKEQMKMAVLQQEHYVLMQVVYDFRLKQGTRCDAFVNPIKCLGEGKLKGEDSYWLWF